MKKLLFALFIGFAAVSCATSDAADTPASSGVSYADILAVFSNSAGNAEVFKSLDGRTWSAPSTGIEGAYRQHAVVDNNVMLVLTDKGLYHSGDGWKTFRKTMGLNGGNTPHIEYIGNNEVLFYSGEALYISDNGGEGCVGISAYECAWKMVDNSFHLNISGLPMVALDRPVLVK